ncbi:hypothetical protein G3I60_13760 [Streptomyces sp. SID13666]|uniref:cupin domain-containing protein n=1 Tax=unclassified Streptomyces TaxID=2593676 RepID=UPI0013BF2F06|nr:MULTISPECIES: hypothetical protein [unclassified Streptomyces]NEA55185.1 hypothetical protein [Streptomyces sp. SID13666]NEA71192.1 hypothetical protein [Streptomyces sp. SID13588]
MEIKDSGPAAGIDLTSFGSHGVRHVSIHRNAGTGTPSGPASPVVAVALMHLAPGGRLGRHQATIPQALTVVAGNGWVSGADGRAVPITTGQAACWAAGEDHETWTDTGLTAVVVEAAEPHPTGLLGRAPVTEA